MGRIIPVRRADGQIYREWTPSWYDWVWFGPLVAILIPVGLAVNAYEWLRWRGWL